MGEVVDLRRPIPIEDDEFIENLARFADGTLTEAAVKAKYRLTRRMGSIGTNDTLVEKIEDVKIHRIRSGRTKRERAQNEIIDAPPILGGIMRESNRQRTAQNRFNQSPQLARHRWVTRSRSSWSEI